MCQCIWSINLLTEHSSLLQSSQIFLLNSYRHSKTSPYTTFLLFKKKTHTQFQTPFFPRLSNWKSIEWLSEPTFTSAFYTFGLRDGEQSFEAWNRWRLLLLFPLEKKGEKTAPNIECLLHTRKYLLQNEKALCWSRYGTNNFESHYKLYSSSRASIWRYSRHDLFIWFGSFNYSIFPTFFFLIFWKRMLVGWMNVIREQHNRAVDDGSNSVA